MSSEDKLDEDYLVKKLPEDQRNYLETRWVGQKNYYSKNAAKNKNKYHGMQIILIATGALIPIINTINIDDVQVLGDIRLASSILGGIILAVTGILQLKKFQENWIQYRTTAEILKKEKQLFLHGIGEYANLDDVTKFKFFVERIESSISTQNTRFFVAHSEQPRTSEETSHNV